MWAHHQELHGSICSPVWTILHEGMSIHANPYCVGVEIFTWINSTSLGVLTHANSSLHRGVNTCWPPVLKRC